MNIVVGGFYTIKDEFFEMVNDPYLYRNHPNGGYRPHFLAIYDKDTDLYWMVPCTTQVRKYQTYLDKYNLKLMNARTQQDIDKINKKKLGFLITEIAGKRGVLLFADMFPITINFIDHEYIKNQVHYCLDSVSLSLVNSQAVVVKDMLVHGYKFVSTQPNISRIAKICHGYNNNCK